MTKGKPKDKAKDKDRIVIFDTTLRDGEQSPGASMNLEEKLRIAKVLEELGVDIIEAGFPIASNGDFEAVREISKTVTTPIICALARAHRQDIERAAEALEPAKRKRIHTFISTSPLHMKYKLQMEPEEVHQAVVDSVTRARNLCDDVEWSCEDGSRTASKSPLDAIGKPASIISTPSSSNTLAMRSFSSRFMDAPGDCSPSRKVVSNMMTRFSSLLLLICLVLHCELWLNGVHEFRP